MCTYRNLEISNGRWWSKRCRLMAHLEFADYYGTHRHVSLNLIAFVSIAIIVHPIEYCHYIKYSLWTGRAMIEWWFWPISQWHSLYTVSQPNRTARRTWAMECIFKIKVAGKHDRATATVGQVMAADMLPHIISIRRYIGINWYACMPIYRYDLIAYANTPTC